jgi:hypothetical protein
MDTDIADGVGMMGPASVGMMVLASIGGNGSSTRVLDIVDGRSITINGVDDGCEGVRGIDGVEVGSSGME